MKKRFRYYARHGWDVVEVNRANLYKYKEDGEFGNKRHYVDMRTWCNDTFPKDSWEATLDIGNRGIKKFAFKEGKFATMFRLKWAT